MFGLARLRSFDRTGTAFASSEDVLVVFDSIAEHRIEYK